MNNHLIHDVIRIIPKKFKDEKVFFLRYLILEIIKLGIEEQFVQDNYSFSKKLEQCVVYTFNLHLTNKVNSLVV